MKTSEKEVLKTKNSTAILKVDPQNLILRDEFNVRRDMGDLNALMESIVATGLQVPLKAKKVTGTEQYEVVDGHRRMSAILLAIEQGHEILYVDVMTFSGNDEEQVMSMLVTGVGQKPLTEIEQAEAIKRLTGFGHRIEDIAKKMGKSLPHVYYLVKLSNLPMKIKNLIAEGYISGLAVIEIVESEPNEELQMAMIEMAIEDAQKDAKEGERKKATKKNIDSTKKKKPIELFKELVMTLNEAEIENEKVSLLNELWTRINEDEDTDDLILLFS
jgi:ParB family chromosome partitioning protein